MTDRAERAAALLETLAKLPPFTGIVFHGVPGIPELSTARWTRGVTATSRDPRIATENFRTTAIAEIDPNVGLLPTLDGLLARVAELLRHARSLPPVPVTTPGKFVEPLFFADESGQGPR